MSVFYVRFDKFPHIIWCTKIMDIPATVLAKRINTQAKFDLGFLFPYSQLLYYGLVIQADPLPFPQGHFARTH